MPTIISATSFTNPSGNRSSRSLENVLKLFECVSLSIKISGEYAIQKQFNKICKSIKPKKRWASPNLSLYYCLNENIKDRLRMAMESGHRVDGEEPVKHKKK